MDHQLAMRRWSQRTAFVLLWFCGAGAVLILLAVVGYVMAQGIQVIDARFLLTAPRGGLAGEGGISTTIVTTVYLVLLAVGIATPVAVGAAIYFVEYASGTEGQSGLMAGAVVVARFGVETLAGVPSIIFGLFGCSLCYQATLWILAAVGRLGWCLPDLTRHYPDDGGGAKGCAALLS